MACRKYLVKDPPDHCLPSYKDTVGVLNTFSIDIAFVSTMASIQYSLTGEKIPMMASAPRVAAVCMRAFKQPDPIDYLRGQEWMGLDHLWLNEPED
jgi:hypothetical protein